MEIYGKRYIRKKEVLNKENMRSKNDLLENIEEMRREIEIKRGDEKKKKGEKIFEILGEEKKKSIKLGKKDMIEILKIKKRIGNEIKIINERRNLKNDERYMVIIGEEDEEVVIVWNYKEIDLRRIEKSIERSKVEVDKEGKKDIVRMGGNLKRIIISGWMKKDDKEEIEEILIKEVDKWIEERLKEGKKKNWLRRLDKKGRMN